MAHGAISAAAAPPAASCSEPDGAPSECAPWRRHCACACTTVGEGSTRSGCSGRGCRKNVAAIRSSHGSATAEHTRCDKARSVRWLSRSRRSPTKTAASRARKSLDAVPPDPHECLSEGRTDQCHTVWHGSRSPARAHARTSTRPLARPERSGYSRVLGDGHPRALVHHTPSRVNSTFAGLRVGYRTYSTGAREGGPRIAVPMRVGYRTHSTGTRERLLQTGSKASTHVSRRYTPRLCR